MCVCVCTCVGEVRSGRLKPNCRAATLLSNKDTSQPCSTTTADSFSPDSFECSHRSSELIANLVGEVVAVHLVAVGLAPWTLDLDAVALQDGCFFKGHRAHHRAPTEATGDSSRLPSHQQSEFLIFLIQVEHEQHSIYCTLIYCTCQLSGYFRHFGCWFSKTTRAALRPRKLQTC